MDFPFQIAILIMSVVVHEVSHGYAAGLLGDDTAKWEGRLTLNPLRHLDPLGSFIVPLVAYFTGGFIFGWAKPVPYNPYNLRPGRWSEAIVAGAGPLSNLSIALVFGLILRSGATLGWANQAFVDITAVVVFINLILAVFNLVPIPPLDGSKLLLALFPEKMPQLRAFFDRYGLILVLLFIFFFWKFILPIVALAFTFITGIAI